MGITCKPYGKYESMFKKLDYQLKKEKEDMKHRGETKKGKKPDKKED